MKRKHLKGTLAAIAFLAVGWFGLMVYAMTDMSMLHLIMCSSGEGGTRIPSRLCAYYPKHRRGNAEDMEELAIGGLDPILNGESKKKYEIAEFLMAKGLDVDGINHYYVREPSHVTPLHASVIYNDVERARFLLGHGADPNIKIESRHYNDMTAIEIAKTLQQRMPKQDRSELIRLLAGFKGTDR